MIGPCFVTFNPLTFKETVDNEAGGFEQSHTERLHNRTNDEKWCGAAGEFFELRKVQHGPTWRFL